MHASAHLPSPAPPASAHALPQAASPYLKLPLSFDSARMREECEHIALAHWQAHFNTTAYDRGWDCIPLRSVDGRIDHIMPVEGAAYRDTAILENCPYLRQVVASFACEKTSVRLMALAPGQRIREHRDPGTDFDHGLVRLHVPVQTAPTVLFRIDGEPVHFSEGDTWYLNASCLHGVDNDSGVVRIHLMLDCLVNPWLEQVFAQAGFTPAPPPRYDDPSIHDGNVDDVIAQLTQAGSEAALQVASRLAAARDAARQPGAAGRANEAGNAAAPLRQWYPFDMTDEPPGLLWRHLGEKRFIEPFFTDTLSAAGARRSRSTPLSALAELAWPDGSVAPSAFIFHVSRCGSTLLTQALATLDHCIVMSEPPVLDAFLQRSQAGTESGAHGDAATLRLLVAALGQRRFAQESHMVVKFDCWHIGSLDLIRRAFPATPCLFLYRQPAAVLASHRRQRGLQMVPGLIDLSRLGFDAGGLVPGDLDGYAARVLEAVFASALAQARSQPLYLLNYDELSPAVFSALLERWAIPCSAQQLEAMTERSRFHSKQRGAPFQGDPQAEPVPAGAALDEAYAQLERWRRWQR